MNNNWTNYKHFKKEVKRAIRKAEYDFVNNITEEGLKNNDTKPFCRCIESRKQDNIWVSSLKDKGALHSDSQEKANILLRQFQPVFTKDGANENLSDVEHKTIRHPFTDISIDVSSVSNSLRTSKASGPDSIPNRILKSCADSIALSCHLPQVLYH